MNGYRWGVALCVAVMALLAQGEGIDAQQQVVLFRQKPDPYGFPRPAPGQTNVPVRTSIYFELGVSADDGSDYVLPDSVTVQVKAEGESPVRVLEAGWQFAKGYHGKRLGPLFPRSRHPLSIYVDSDGPLKPATTYAVQVTAKSANGAVLAADRGTWKFTTEAPQQVQPVSFDLDVRKPSIRWNGGFFTGFLKLNFCSTPGLIRSYDLMAEVRKSAPKAWSLQRDAWMTGMDHRLDAHHLNLPNIVRELETRRITSIENRNDATELRVEDFYGHEQYGIPTGRPLSADYHAGDEVLIVDWANHATATVISADNRAGTVRVSKVTTPASGWRLDYMAPLLTVEDPMKPGRFAFGGCYLQKFRPSGTPRYYWGRLDAEWDRAHQQYGRRLLVNFLDAPGDLSVDGQNWTTTKDYIELHEVARAITGHVIERYGEASLDFVYSVFNEPDLGAAFWRCLDWNEMQRFYDYTVDGVLRAFEDHGLDSKKAFVGGLELGAVFGTNLRLREFLAHCSPRADANGALPLNAAYADPRLAGKRSQRVETLCGANDGRGSPCDFISIHSYNTSALMAAKLIRAKEMALEIDEDYYANLWIDSHECCPSWGPPPDEAAADSYLGNGYFPSWCADVARRQLARAHEDPRFAFGETILDIWNVPNRNFTGLNAVASDIHVDENGDGGVDRKVTVGLPILNFVGLLAAMGDRFWVLPEQRRGGHVVSGFASQTENDIRVLLYSHHGLDIQSRSGAEFDVDLDLSGLNRRQVHVDEYRFDKDHNSYYRLAAALREKGLAARGATLLDAHAQRMMAEGIESLLSEPADDQQLPFARLRGEGDEEMPPRFVVSSIKKLIETSQDATSRSIAQSTLDWLERPDVYSPSEAARIEALSKLQITESAAHSAGPDGHLRLKVRAGGNGATFLVIKAPAGKAAE